MNLAPLLGGIANGALMGYALGGMGGTANASPGAATPQLGGSVNSAALPGIMPGAVVPLDTGVGAGGGMFGGVGQGLTNASAGLFQPGSGSMVGGSAPAIGGGMNPLVMALLMNRR